MALQEYRRKRDFRQTPEPKATVAESGGKLSFVIQKHDATRLHYDFRLELNGVLKSWAVPKGPSLDPAVKSLAVEVEDHPVAYAAFEGIIPAGEYGGGTVLVWDRGTWETDDDDPERALKKGHLRFHLHGEKLTGGWSLIRLRDEGKRHNWLLMKRKDEAAIAGDGHGVTEREVTSVLSNRDLTEIATDADRVWTKRGEQQGTKKSVSGKTPAMFRGVAAKPGGRGSRRAGASGTSSIVHGSKGASPSHDIDSKVSKPPQRRSAVADIAGAVPAKLPRKLAPQLALLADKPPAGAEWLHELKFDGYRILAEIDDGAVRLLTRNGNDWTRKFQATADQLKLPGLESAVLDGELVALDERGVASFQRLQNAIREQRTEALIYYVFDLPFLNGYDLRAAKLLDRKETLAAILLGHNPRNDGPIRYSDHIEGEGASVLQRSCAAALEGIICKRADSRYESRRSGSWLKVKCHGRQEFVICGFTKPAGSRVGFGALLLGYYEGDALQYAGRVGTGFDQRLLSALRKRLDGLAVDRSPFASRLSSAERRGVTYVRPELVAEIEFTEWTDDGHLRHPSFQGLREDKSAGDVVRERPQATTTNASKGGTPVKKASTKKAATRVSDPDAKRATGSLAGVTLTHPERVLFPDVGVTKLDLARYYADIADWILPHVIDRPLSLVRCPDGSTGQCFYQKHWKDTLPGDVNFVTIGEKSGTGKYVKIENLAGLISLVQISVLEIHPWGAKSDNVEQPDRVVLDLDPGPGVEWPAVVHGAREVRRVLQEFGVESFVRTSGGKGLHVVVPLSRRNTWDEVAAFAHDIAQGLATHDSQRYVANMRKSLREGRIYLDYLRNQRGATAVASYSTRSRPGCPVAMPLGWKELGRVRSAAAFTIANVPQRLAKLRNDPWDGFFKVRQILTKKILKQAHDFARPSGS